MEVLLTSVASEENSSTQLLSAFILLNIGGTFSWAGESYTIGWLVKKAGLTSLFHRNMIRNIDWLDPCLSVHTRFLRAKSILNYKRSTLPGNRFISNGQEYLIRLDE